MSVSVVGTTTLIWGEVVMQSPGSWEEIICGSIERACIYVLYCDNTPGSGLIFVHSIRLLVFE